MKVLRKSVDKDGKLTIQIPKELGKTVEVIILPIVPGEAGVGATKYFEYATEDGREHRTYDWIEEDFNRLTRVSVFKDDDTRAEDIFDV